MDNWNIPQKECKYLHSSCTNNVVHDIVRLPPVTNARKFGKNMAVTHESKITSARACYTARFT